MPENKTTEQSAPGGDDALLMETFFRFTGRVISLFVHEFNNHLATIRESSGLGDDIISTGTLSDREKLKELEKVLHSIEGRTGQSSALVRAFGSIGRSIEAEADSIDIFGLVEGLFPFLAKLARQKSLEVHLTNSRDLPAVCGNLPLMQCLVFALFENLCESLEPGTAIRLSTDKTSSSVRLSLTPDRCPAQSSVNEPWQWKSVEMLAAAVPSCINQYKEGGSITIEIRLQK